MFVVCNRRRVWNGGGAAAVDLPCPVVPFKVPMRRPKPHCCAVSTPAGRIRFIRAATLVTQAWSNAAEKPGTLGGGTARWGISPRVRGRDPGGYRRLKLGRDPDRHRSSTANNGGTTSARNAQNSAVHRGTWRSSRSETDAAHNVWRGWIELGELVSMRSGSTVPFRLRGGDSNGL